jgi:hypothetical protein
VGLTGAFTGLDWRQVTVAAVATGSYAVTSILVQRVYAARRRRRAWLEARFVSRLIERAGAGSIHTATDVETISRRMGLTFARDDHRLVLLIQRARVRLRRSGMEGHNPDADSRRRAADALDQLSTTCRAVWMDGLVRRGRIAADGVDGTRIDALLESLSEGAAERKKRRARQRQTAAIVWRSVIGVGCIAFVQIALVFWHSWL